MSDVGHTRLKAIFAEVADLEPGAARDARLRELCGDDDALRAQVARLLRFDAPDADDEGLGPGAELRADLDALWDGQVDTLQGRDGTDPARYAIERLLGEGGFGSVYLAWEQEPIPRQVAIKVLKPGMDSREVLARFDSERRTLALMDHPGIARVYAAGVDLRGRPYFAMEYVEGRPITEFCDERRTGVRERLELFVLVCQAIQHAHYKGIVHRDVKPANVLVTLVDGAPSAKVIDFGIAKAIGGDGQRSVALTHAGQLVGTPLAMSPEQVRGHGEVDTRADVYALGVLMYELLCGAPPFSPEHDTGDLSALRQRILDEDPPRPSQRLAADAEAAERAAGRRGTSARALLRELASDLDWIVMRALEKDPERRYLTANDLALDVQRALAHEPVLACPPSRSYQLARFVRRHRAGLAAAAVMVVLLVGGVIGTTLGWLRSERALKTARAHALQAAQESRHARDINAFLNEDLLGAVSPESLGFDVPMRRVLDVAARKLEDRFGQRPRTERSIRLTLGRTYRALALIDAAEEQLVAGLATLPAAPDDADGPTDVEDRARLTLELAQVRLLGNRNAEAEQLLRPSWQRCAQELGATHAVTLETRHALGVSLAEQERFDEARTVFADVRAGALASVGERHELAIQALHSQAMLQMSEARARHGPLGAETVVLFEQALGASREFHGPDDPRSVRRLMDFAVALDAAAVDGADGAVLELFAEAHQRSSRVQGPDHPTTAVAALALGRVHLRAGALSLALPWLEQGHAIASALGGAHPVLQDARVDLAMARTQQERFDEAVALAEAAFHADAQASVSPEPTAFQVGLAGLLAEVCALAGRPDDAARWGALSRGH